MYFPLSQIKQNQYTNGGEYILTSTSEDYVGYYFSTSTGKYYSGKNTYDTPNIELINSDSRISPPTFNPGFNEGVITVDPYLQIISNVEIYNNIFKPYYNPEYPTDQDYVIGEFRRYFCKRTNNIFYIEIDKTQYDLLVNQDPKILFSMYVPFYIPWDISGDKNQVQTTNRNVVELTSFRNKFPKLGEYLKFDYIKYYK